MTKRRFVPREGRHTSHHLDAQPSRDAAALILPLSAIHVPENIRSHTDIQELAESIKAHGILQPLVVTKGKGRLELVAGQRRYAALLSLGIKEAPVRIIGTDAAQVAVLRLIENIQREQLDGMDEIKAVAKLAPLFSDQVTLAAALGKSKSYVSRCLKAWKLSEELGVATSQLSKGVLFELADAERPEALAERLKSGQDTKVQEARESRKPSGAVPGGRYGSSGAVQFKERNEGRSFTLRLNFDVERTPAESKERIISLLEQLLNRLRNLS